MLLTTSEMLHLQAILILCCTMPILKCLSLPWQGQQDTCDRYIDVAVVGAGPAGAYSAYRLRNENLTIEVFEFSNRVGGRLYTSSLPNVPDVPIELGGMRYIPKVQPRIASVIQELGLSSRPFANDSTDFRFFLRGKSYSLKEVTAGDIPYNLSLEEKANQARIFRYYLEELTGYNGTNVDEVMLLNLKVPDGRYLYTIPIDEALSMVGTQEGKHFMMALDQFESDFAPDTSLAFLENNLGPYSKENPVMVLTEGMSSIPQGLIQIFLNASSRHKLSMNRQLVSVSSHGKAGYKLVFHETKTVDGITTVLNSEDVVCAKKVILAIPKFALSQINWPPLRDGRVFDAISAVREIKVFKIFLTFSTRWWLDNSRYPARVTYSDLSFSQFYDWGRSNDTGHYVMLASYSDEKRAQWFWNLNSEGTPLNGPMGGAHTINREVLDRLLDDLSNAFGIDRNYVPEPLSAAAQFWNSYPFGGGWTVWKAGYRYDDVISTVQRPSLSDDVFYVGADHARGYHVGWVEGALETVDRVLDMYFM